MKPNILYFLLIASVLCFSTELSAKRRYKQPEAKRVQVAISDNTKPQVLTKFQQVKPLGGKDTIRLMFLGDVMMHRDQLPLDYTKFFAPIAEQMREAELCVINMEFTLAGEPYSGYPRFSAPESFVEHLITDCGVDIILTANNHILDYGSSGLNRTLTILDQFADQYGILYTGSAADAAQLAHNYPLMRPCKGVRLAFVNFTYGTNLASKSEWPSVCYLREKEVRAAIELARSQGADFIIALPHWGDEYKLTHNDAQEGFAQKIIQWGADAVVGTHPHVVQDSQLIDGKPVFYSLGNAVSNMTAKNTQRGMVVYLSFEVDRSTNEKRVLETETRFTYCKVPGNIVSFEDSCN